MTPGKDVKLKPYNDKPRLTPEKDFKCVLSYRTMKSLWFLLWLWLWSTVTDGKPNPNTYQVFNYTWQVLSQAGDPIWSISKVAAPWTWWPTLYSVLCKLAFGAPANWDMEGYYDPNMKAPSEPSPLGRLGLDPWGGCGHPSR